MGFSCAYASGPYDGIWETSPYGYAIISERDGILIAVNIYHEAYGGDWEAFQGERIGNSTRASALVAKGNLILDLTMTSDTTFTLTQVDCIPKDVNDTYCVVPNGTILMLGNKVW
ncbi:hypothetical protein SAMN05421510_102925 [Nitrosomonas ureae]|uniref:Uncharacterized protein n=2 Tax=Nitrosomonas ureae TaxID=44577 RepID=A0A1H9EB39_9PROT|nr:hypothetical protein SAMN05421510_102925 [Nitrosomonas ureae]